MKITPERLAKAQELSRTPLNEHPSTMPLPRVTAAYLAAVRGVEADQNRVGVTAFPGLRFTDASGDDGLAFVHPLALDRVIILALTGDSADEGPQAETSVGRDLDEVTHAYSPGQARALAMALLVLADEAEADSATEVPGV